MDILSEYKIINKYRKQVATIQAYNDNDFIDKIEAVAMKYAKHFDKTVALVTFDTMRYDTIEVWLDDGFNVSPIYWRYKKTKIVEPEKYMKRYSVYRTRKKWLAQTFIENKHNKQKVQDTILKVITGSRINMCDFIFRQDENGFSEDGYLTVMVLCKYRNGNHVRERWFIKIDDITEKDLMNT